MIRPCGLVSEPAAIAVSQMMATAMEEATRFAAAKLMAKVATLVRAWEVAYPGMDRR